MKRTVKITDEASLQQTLSSIQFPCSIEISYLIRKSNRYALRDDLPERFGFEEFEGAWGFQNDKNFYDTMCVVEICKMALALHADLSLTIDEFTPEEYVAHVKRRHGLVNGPKGWAEATEEQILERYERVKKETESTVHA
jgi:hypothetical protein